MTDPEDVTPPPTPDDAEPHSAVESFFRPIVEDESLRPVVASVLIGLATVVGWGILLAVRDRRPGAIIATVLLTLLSIEWLVRARRNNGRLGVAGWSVIVVWIASIGFAIGGEMTGYL